MVMIGVKSICYVVLPDNLFLDDNNMVYTFVKNHIINYYSELEVEPYKKFFSEKETLEIAKRKGFSNLSDFEEYLENNKNDDGIENGLYFWNTTFNEQGRWDGFRLDGLKIGYDLMNEVPYSVVTPDGNWHSERDYGYKPILDFNNGFKQHSDNIEPRKKWIEYLDSFYREYKGKNFAILFVHS
ncbi:hypothetical protein A8708_16615 [Paenibacillus oryzisoli]|uniref:Uncharacterized protein n=2 Tax=Paenibacillus oryzisoli TaxID=1850517 RepID=A0A198AKE2_9BACL|nr:hypothetical protein A8708_16615 [Paenibacillus oryzisoli]